MRKKHSSFIKELLVLEPPLASKTQTNLGQGLSKVMRYNVLIAGNKVSKKSDNDKLGDTDINKIKEIQ